MDHHRQSLEPTSVAANETELLLFRLGDKQLFGIDVARVREVVRCPELRHLPHASPLTRGVMTLRRDTFTVIDTAATLGKPISNDAGAGYVIVILTQDGLRGLLASHVDRIIKIDASQLRKPPKSVVAAGFIEAIFSHQELFVEVVHIEHVLALCRTDAVESAPRQAICG